MNTEQMAEVFLKVISTQSFESWHDNDFQDYITGENEDITEAAILRDLQGLISRFVK